MVPSSDRTAPSAPTNWPLVIGVLFICACMSGAVYWQGHRETKSQVAGVERKVQRAAPCIDRSDRQGVQLSRGCKVLYNLLANQCAQDPTFCARSQRQAVRRAQDQATREQIGPVALLGGGGGSGGGNPNSPTRPSPSPKGGGQGDGDTGQPNPPPSGGDGQGGNDQGGQATAPDKPTVTVPDAQDTIHQIAPNLCSIPSPLGGPPLIQICQ